MGKPLDPLQRLHNDGALLRARVFTPLGNAAASRPERSERLHGGRGYFIHGAPCQASHARLAPNCPAGAVGQIWQTKTTMPEGDGP